MYEVLQVGGVTILEWMVLVLFVLLFAWIAFSFMSALAGFAVLLFRMKDPLGIDPNAPLPVIESRNAMLLPTYNENPYQIMARLRAMCQVGRADRLWCKLRLVCAERHDRPFASGSQKRNAFCGSGRTSGPAMFTIVIAPKIPPANPAISKTGSSGSAPPMII